MEGNYCEQVLRNLGVNPEKLPALDLNHADNRISVTEMTHPVMQFRDPFGRSGIAIHLVGKTDELYNDGLRDIPIKDISVILIIFERMYGSLIYTWGEGRNILEHFYHWKTGGQSPFEDQVDSKQLKAWLDGSEEWFGLPKPLEITRENMEISPSMISVLKKMVELDHPILKELGLVHQNGISQNFQAK